MFKAVIVHIRLKNKTKQNKINNKRKKMTTSEFTTMYNSWSPQKRQDFANFSKRLVSVDNTAKLDNHGVGGVTSGARAQDRFKKDITILSNVSSRRRT